MPRDAMSFSADRNLIRKCIGVLDKIHCDFNCNNYLQDLKELEVNTHSNHYETFNSFKTKLLELPFVTSEYVDNLNLNAAKQIPEEYCNSPIYNNIQLRKDSFLYAINIKSHKNLHLSLYNDVVNNRILPYTHRLYIKKKPELLIDARDNINSILSLFFDLETKPCVDKRHHSTITAKVALVHPLGDYQEASFGSLHGWIKVKLIKVTNVNAIIPQQIADRLEKEQVVRQIMMKSTLDTVTARDNEITRQFMHTIMGTGPSNSIEPVYEQIMQNHLNTPLSTYTRKNNLNPVNVNLSRSKKSLLSSPVLNNKNITLSTNINSDSFKSESKISTIINKLSRNNVNSKSSSSSKINNVNNNVKANKQEDSSFLNINSITHHTTASIDKTNNSKQSNNSTVIRSSVINSSSNNDTQDSQGKKNEVIPVICASPLTPLSKQVSLASHWENLLDFCHTMNVQAVHRSKYGNFKDEQKGDKEGSFKQVHFLKDDVVQIFQGCTTSQRVTELVSLLALKNSSHIGQISEIIYDDQEVVGLTMDRYDMTLKEYLDRHTHSRLTPQQRMSLITQMLRSMKESHDMGIAHRDLATVNFMVNVQQDGPELYLIDFGKAVFFIPEDAKKWWVDSDDRDVYKNEVKPMTRDELSVWCKNLPYVMAKPDHGYRLYRSIQTLPKNNRDHNLLPYLIDPVAEDIYSLGTIIWKVFTGIEPWPGVFDTDLKKLRETCHSDLYIDSVIERSLQDAEASKTFMKKFLRVNPEYRKSVSEILDWIEQEDVKEALLQEWNVDSTRKASRKTREDSTPQLQTKTRNARFNSPPAANTTSVEKRRRLILKATEPETSNKFINQSTLSADAQKRKIVLRAPQPASQPAQSNPAASKRRIVLTTGSTGSATPTISKLIFKQKSESDNQVIAGSSSISYKRGRIQDEEKDASNRKVPIAKAPNPYYKYVKTGKPRGRPKKKVYNKKALPSAEDTSSLITEKATLTTTAKGPVGSNQERPLSPTESTTEVMPALTTDDALAVNSREEGTPSLSPQSTPMLSPASTHEEIHSPKNVKRRFDDIEDQENQENISQTKKQNSQKADPFDLKLFYILQNQM